MEKQATTPPLPCKWQFVRLKIYLLHLMQLRYLLWCERILSCSYEKKVTALLPLLSGGLLDLAYTCSIRRSCATSSGVSESLRAPPPTLKAPFKEKNKQKSQEIKKQFRYKYILVYKNI